MNYLLRFGSLFISEPPLKPQKFLTKALQNTSQTFLSFFSLLSKLILKNTKNTRSFRSSGID
jgi:hypothetical protein